MEVGKNRQMCAIGSTAVGDECQPATVGQKGNETVSLLACVIKIEIENK